MPEAYAVNATIFGRFLVMPVVNCSRAASMPRVPDRFRKKELDEIITAYPSATFVFGQHIIGHFRVDFLLVATGKSPHSGHLLVVECDGAYHLDQVEEDAIRDQKIRAAGYEIMRFKGTEIVNDIGWVFEQIRAWILQHR